MVIDIHTHCFPDAIAERAMEVLVGNCGVQPVLDGTCTQLQASMRSAGVDKSVIMPIATKPAQARGINRWAAEINGSSSDLISFGSIHPAQEDWREEIDRIAADDIKGVKFHPDYQEFFVDDPGLVPMYRALADAGLVVLFHAGVDIGLPPPVHCPPDRLARVLDAVPDLTVVAAHMGGYESWDDVERYLVGRDIYFDTSYSMADLGRERMSTLIKAHGTEKVLFGTDSPWTDQKAEVEAIRGLDLTEEEKTAILGGNAERLLGYQSRVKSAEHGC